MRRIDYHMHTYFSTDSKESPRNHVLQAIKNNIEEICFTDHQDFYYPEVSFDVDIDNYYQEIMALKDEFKDQITIKWGIEMGLDINCQKEINEVVKKYPFDFVIGSMHVYNNMDISLPTAFYANKTKDQVHHDFFKATLECVKTFDCFTVLGHLDYIVRYGPYDDKTINYALHQELIDEILLTLIEKGKGIEVNTSGYAVHQTCGFPNYEIVTKYYQYGGRIITVGTDSHTSDRVGQHVDDVLNKLETIGFKDVSTFTNRIRDNV